MAKIPMGERERAAQIAALALDRGHTAEQVRAKLFDYGIDYDTPQMAQALNDAARSIRLSAAIQIGDEATAQAILGEMAAVGQGNVVVSAVAKFRVPSLEPVEEGKDIVYREIQMELPASASAGEIMAMFEDEAEEMLSDDKYSFILGGALPLGIDIRTAIGK